MNAQELVNLVARRVPGFDPSEYFSELNDAYQEAWDYVVQLDDGYFTDVAQVNVLTSQDNFDLQWNQDGALDKQVSRRLFQIDRVRVLFQSSNGWIPADPLHWNQPDFLAQQQNPTPGPQTTGPIFYILYGRDQIRFSRPLAVGTFIEVTFSSEFMPLTTLAGGTISSSGATVTGVGTNFTQLLGPDFQSNLPGAQVGGEVVGGESSFSGFGLEIEAELIAGGFTQRVKTITDDTHLTLYTVPPVALSGATYTLATVPDIPSPHHRVIATLTTRNMLTTPAEDDRFQEWAAMSKVQIERLKDTVQERQRQKNTRRGRFPFGAVRRGRFTGVR